MEMAIAVQKVLCYGGQDVGRTQGANGLITMPMDASLQSLEPGSRYPEFSAMNTDRHFGRRLGRSHETRSYRPLGLVVAELPCHCVYTLGKMGPGPVQGGAWASAEQDVECGGFSKTNRHNGRNISWPRGNADLACRPGCEERYCILR